MAPDDVQFGVGAHRYVGEPVRLEPDRRLFAFTD